MNKHIIVATVGRQVYSAYVMYTVDGTYPIRALKAASAEYLYTDEGKEYVRDIGSSGYNIGDAVVTIPHTILARHGILEFENVSNLGFTTLHERSYDEPLVSGIQAEILESLRAERE